jgi:TATA-box binding protein (TBP) (component of TFIID and TFIIIB)
MEQQMDENLLEPIDLSLFMGSNNNNSAVNIYRSLIPVENNVIKKSTRGRKKKVIDGPSAIPININSNETQNQIEIDSQSASISNLNENTKKFEKLLETITNTNNLNYNNGNSVNNSNKIDYNLIGYEDMEEELVEKDTKIHKCLKWFEEEKRKLVPKSINPTNYSISTITTNCRIVFYNKEENKTYNIFINYLKLFKYLELHEKVIESKKYRFLSKRYNWDTFQCNKKPDQSQKNKFKKENSKMKGIFYNQITLEIFSKISNKNITTFLYDNGSMNNTGNKCIDDTKYVSDILISELIRFHKIYPILYYYNINEYGNINENSDINENGDINENKDIEQLKQETNNESKKKKKKDIIHKSKLDLSNWENKNDLNYDDLDTFLNEKLKIIGDELNETNTLILYSKKNIEKVEPCEAIPNYETIHISTMNAQYSIGINLIREQLYEIIKNNNDNKQECGTNDGIYFVILQTSNYAGINIKIKWKDDCKQLIHQKSKKKWKCDCRDITILAFQSGEIMISGARSFKELDYAKKLFDELIQNNLEKVVDIDLSNIIPIPSQKKAKRIEKFLGTEYLQGKKFDVYEYVNESNIQIPVKIERRGRKKKVII